MIVQRDFQAETARAAFDRAQVLVRHLFALRYRSARPGETVGPGQFRLVGIKPAAWRVEVCPAAGDETLFREVAP